MAVATGMLVDVEQDSQTTAGNVVQLCTVDEDIAVCTLKYRFEALGCLSTGSIVEVADKGSHESSVLFTKCDFKHTLLFFMN